MEGFSNKPLFGEFDYDKVAEELARLRKYMETGSLAKSVTQAIKSCNLLFSNLTNGPTIFREDIPAISALHQPCNDENDFNLKLGSLGELFQADTEAWKPLLREFDPWMKRGNTLLLKWLDEQKITYDSEKVQVWDAIIELRNASFPYHPANKKLVGLVKFFGHGFPINYCDFYESILRKFLESLKMLQTILYDAYLRR